jgi:homoserine kinase
MKQNEITVYAPATVANIVCGFDILGFALQEPGDRLRIRLTAEPGVKITNNDSFGLTTVPAENVIGAALLALLKEVPEPLGFDVLSTKSVMPGSGIGSSAASAAGAVVGANALLGNRFSRTELIRLAMYGEEVASGVKHADNIAPCIYGGITLIRSVEPIDIIPIAAPPLFVTVVHPQIEVRTADSREILKKSIALKTAVKQWGNIAGLVAGFLQKDYALISRSLEDVVAEPTRSMLIPGFDEVKKQSLLAGALGGGISGSGPSVFMFSQTEAQATTVSQISLEIYKKIGIDCHTYVTRICTQGVRVLSPADYAHKPLKMQ